MTSNEFAAFLFLIFLFTFIGFLENNARLSIVWINLERESAYEDVEYGQDTADYMGSGKEFSSHSQFLQQSFQTLSKVYVQNPNPEKHAGPKFDKKPEANIDIKYNFSTSGNHTRLAMQYNSDWCSPLYANFLIKEAEIYNATESFADNITNCIVSSISNQNSSYLFIGTDHGLSLLTVKAAKKLDYQSKIGIIVFDEHVDIYGMRNENNIIGKENVFGKLLAEGYADYIVFLETSESAKKWFRYTANQNFTRNEIFERMEVYSDFDLNNGKWQAVLSKSINKMKKEGITNIMISFDLDTLPTAYTGFEYSIIAPAIAEIRFGGNRTNPSFAEVEEGFSEGIKPAEIKSYISHIKYHAAISGIKFGVTNGNSIILGDIQELLPKQDLNNETTRAASQIASFFAR